MCCSTNSHFKCTIIRRICFTGTHMDWRLNFEPLHWKTYLGYKWLQNIVHSTLFCHILFCLRLVTSYNLTRNWRTFQFTCQKNLKVSHTSITFISLQNYKWKIISDFLSSHATKLIRKELIPINQQHKSNICGLKLHMPINNLLPPT